MVVYGIIEVEIKVGIGMNEKLIQVLVQQNYEVNEDVKEAYEALLHAEQNEDHDIDSKSYLHALYVMGKGYEGSDNFKAIRFVAMKMQIILDAFPMVESEYDEKLMAFVKNNQAFLAEKYKIMDKTLRKSTMLNVVVLTAITWFFMRLNIFISLGMGAAIAILMYKVMGKRMNKKLDSKIIEAYANAMSEEELVFIKQKVFL